MQVMIVRKFEKTRGRQIIKHRAYQTSCLSSTGYQTHCKTSPQTKIKKTKTKRTNALILKTLRNLSVKSQRIGSSAVIIYGYSSVICVNFGAGANTDIAISITSLIIILL